MKPRTWLKVLRRQARLSVPELAQVLGVSARSVYRWETGQECPTRQNAMALAVVLGPEVLARIHQEMVDEYRALTRRTPGGAR